MKRRFFLDNIRWVTVLLVLVFHVFYYFHANGGYFGTAGGFHEKQWQDVVMYLLNPWFMLLLFLVAGISARYALQKQPPKMFLNNRTRKLLLPFTLGLLFIGIPQYYYLALTIGQLSPGESYLNVFKGVTGVGTLLNRLLQFVGHLWFIVDLWLFSVLLLPIRRWEKDRLYEKLEHFFQLDEAEPVAHRMMIDAILVVGGFLLVWATTQFNYVVFPYWALTDLWYTFHPLNCFTAFLMGYFVFSHDAVQVRVSRLRIPLLVAAVVFAGWFSHRFIDVPTGFGISETLHTPLGCAYVWLTILAMLACFKAWADATTRFATYMTKASYGIYIVHYLVLAVVGYYLKFHTSLAPWMMYVTLLASVMLLSPLLYEIIKRIPFVRWCVLGMTKTKKVEK